MLTHRNILANVDAIGQVFELNASDVLVGVLPFFHSFGFTGTIWLPAAQRIRRRLPPESDGREDDRRARRRATARRSSSARRRSARPTSGSASPSSSGTCATRSSAPKSCASRSPPRSRRSSASTCSKATAAPRCRRSWRSTCRTSTTDASVSAGHAVGSVGHPLPGVAVKIVDPDDRRGSALRTGRPAAREGSEPDARLSRRTGEDAPRSCATAGTSPATSRRSTRPASCGSPIGCRASARSPARWCRT